MAVGAPSKVSRKMNLTSYSIAYTYGSDEKVQGSKY